MSAIAYIPIMPTLKTPTDLGAMIRQRRKALGWDQGRLALEVGVSRLWVVEIEKGKPRAEIQLVLRALNVLSIRLDATVIGEDAHIREQLPPKLPLEIPDIDAVIQHHRDPSGQEQSPGAPSGQASQGARSMDQATSHDLVTRWLHMQEAREGAAAPSPTPSARSKPAGTRRAEGRALQKRKEEPPASDAENTER